MTIFRLVRKKKTLCESLESLLTRKCSPALEDNNNHDDNVQNELFHVGLMIETLFLKVKLMDKKELLCIIISLLTFIMSGRGVVLMTGASRGLGLAMAEAIVARGAEVINLGRSAAEGERERIRFVTDVDLSDPENLGPVIEGLRDELNGNLLGVIHCAGQAHLIEKGVPEDADAQKKIDLMRQVNYHSAVKLAELLKDIAKENAPFLYVSTLAAAREDIEIPGLEHYSNFKNDALAAIDGLWEKMAVVYPGVFDTKLVRDFVGGEMTPLEFFAAPMAEPEGHPIAEETAEVVLGERKLGNVVHPKFSGMYVRNVDAKRQRWFLPLLVKLFGRHVLEQISQGAEDHDKRVDWHKGKKSYGENFPYDSIRHEKLWSSRISRWLAKGLKKIGWL